MTEAELSTLRQPLSIFMLYYRFSVLLNGEKTCADLIKKNEEIKKNLPPGAIPAISKIDYKAQLLQVAEKLRKPMEQN